jgi:hypothetical protein
MNIKEKLRNVPGPCPWYFTPTFPRLTSSGEPARWVDLGAGNPLALQNSRGETIALIGMYSYVLPLDESSFIVWHQGDSRHTILKTTPPVRLAAFLVDQLQPLSVHRALLARFRGKRLPYSTKGGRLFEIQIPTTSLNSLRLDFPQALLVVDELLILAKSSAIAYPGRQYAHNTCLLIASPPTGTVDFYPQDWFNLGDFDFGYEWITRVARDQETGRFIGDGIRMRPFMLDESRRAIHPLDSGDA